MIGKELTMDDRGSVRSALILAGGDLDPAGAQRHLMQREFQWIIGVDGGARHAVALDLPLTLLVGDMDSIADDVRAALADVPVQRFPEDQDKVDSQLAVEWALDQGAQDIVLAGGIGSRFDQSLANAYLLLTIHRRGAQGVVTDGRQAVYFLQDQLTLSELPGTIVSVLPIGPCRGLTIRGLRWTLKDYDLDPGDSRTISNEFTDAPARFELQSGEALVIVGSKD